MAEQQIVRCLIPSIKVERFIEVTSKHKIHFDLIEEDPVAVGNLVDIDLEDYLRCQELIDDMGPYIKKINLRGKPGSRILPPS